MSNERVMVPKRGKSRGKSTPGKPPAFVLTNPKNAYNVAAVVRAASAYGINQVFFTGSRVSLDPAKGERLPREERMKGYKEVDLVNSDYWFDSMPTGVVPVAIEVRPGSQQLPDFEHPENAVYVFGPEDGSIDQQTLRLCHHFVFIPTKHCLNLSQAVNVDTHE